MCAGAMVLARLPMVVYGTTDPKAGACDTLYQHYLRCAAESSGPSCERRLGRPVWSRAESVFRGQTTSTVSMYPLLITGITGVAGCNAFHYFRRRYPARLSASARGRPGNLPATASSGWTPRTAPGSSELFNNYRFRAVLNCVGNCALKSCELDPAMARLLNVVSAAIIADNVLRHGCRLVHLSSDLVFSGGRDGQLRRNRPDRPGHGLRQNDGARRRNCWRPGARRRRSCGSRCRWGRASTDMPGPSTGFSRASVPGGPRRLYYDEVRSCTYCDDLNGVFE